MPPLPKPNTPVIYIGIDPGKSGGLAAIYHDGSIITTGMPATERDIWDWMLSLRKFACQQVAMIEKVGGFITGGEGRQPGSAMFVFGQSYGSLRMALIGNGVSFDEIHPRSWQKALGISPKEKGVAHSVHKNKLKSKAQQLFPEETVTLKTADALLLAEFCRRKHTGTL